MKASKKEVEKILKQATSLAKRYRELTGRPLGITGEVAEFAAASLLDLELAGARQAGYDAIHKRRGKKDRKVQIKGRCISGKSKSGRLGQIKLNSEWDVVVLVLLDEDMTVLSIYEADRRAVRKALSKPGSKARNIRGQLSISKFKAIGLQIWP